MLHALGHGAAHRLGARYVIWAHGGRALVAATGLAMPTRAVWQILRRTPAFTRVASA
ncbi:MAG: hypothetical protein FWH56_00075 [Betaproteobacteria bacterium]|nr:hypothetical protein [Betaproteobacteria bacterium]